MLIEVLFLTSLGMNIDCYKGLEKQQPYRYVSGYLETSEAVALEDYVSCGGKQFCTVVFKNKEHSKPIKGSCKDLVKGKCTKKSCQPRKKP